MVMVLSDRFCKSNKEEQQLMSIKFKVLTAGDVAFAHVGNVCYLIGFAFSAGNV